MAHRAFGIGQRVEQREKAPQGAGALAGPDAGASEEEPHAAADAAKARRRRARMRGPARRRPGAPGRLEAEHAFDKAFGAIEDVAQPLAAAAPAAAQHHGQEPAQQAQRRSGIGFDAVFCDGEWGFGHGGKSNAAQNRSD